MTELETLERAKMYMEKLANGINPIDGTQIPDTDVVNNVRLSRCFFYVADVLRQVLDNGGITPSSKPVPFALTAEQRAAFEFSTTPITISELAKRINALVTNENMASLSYTAIRDWLMSLGMLEDVLDADGKKTKRPTPRGESVGIGLDARTGNSGMYFVVVYDLAAQHFVLDNLDAILEMERAKKENQGQPWSAEHDNCLAELYRQGVPIKDMAIALKRNTGSVRARLKKLGIIE